MFRERNESDKYIYSDADVIVRTIATLEQIISENDGVMDEIQLQHFVDVVYPDWNIKDREEYTNTLQLLDYSNNNELSPLKHSLEREDDYYKQFDGAKILPIANKMIYQERLNKREYINADNLLVPITKNIFKRLRHSGDLYKEEIFFEGDKEIYSKSLWIIKRKYDKGLGLLINEKDEENIDEQLI